MVSAVLRRLHLKAAVCTFVALAVLGPCSWLGWRWYCFAREERIIASIESQGASVQRGNPDSFRDKVAVFLHGRRCVSLHIFGDHVDMGLAKQLPPLAAIHFDGFLFPEKPPLSITEEDVLAISEIGELETLTMTRVEAPRSLWSALPRLPNLTWLMVEDVQVEDDGIADIGKARGLTILRLDNCAVTDQGLSYLRGLSQVEVLGLRESHISAVGLGQLKYLPSLSSLDLAGCGLNDESLNALASCRALSSLDVSDNPITDKGLEKLSRMPNLGSIRLNNTKITDAGLRVFARQTTIGRNLTVKGTSVTKAGVAKLLAANPLMHIEDVPGP